MSTRKQTLALETCWLLAERRAQRAYENDPASGLSCGPIKVNVGGDRFGADRGVWVFQFGAYGTTHVLAYGTLENALEAAAAWLAEHEPGHLAQPDYAEAQTELCVEGAADFFDTVSGEYGPTEEQIAERAEADLTYTESGWLVSHDWTCTELHAPEELLSYILRK